MQFFELYVSHAERSKSSRHEESSLALAEHHSYDVQ